MMKVNAEKCIGCGQCIKDCFPRDIEMVDGKAIIKNEACFKCSHCIAVCPKEAVSTDEYNMEEVKNYQKEEFEIEPERLLNFIKFRRTVRQFRNKEVEVEKLSNIIEAGRFTQTGTNSQDLSYVVVRDGLQQLKNVTFETLKFMSDNILNNLTEENMSYKRYAEMWAYMYGHYKENQKENDSLFFNAPAVIVVTANSEVNGALAASNMELMTNAVGLGTFFSGFFVAAAKGNKQIVDMLGVKPGKQIVACMVIGYPAVKYSRTVPRKSADVSWK